jgi:hypothetical protein
MPSSAAMDAELSLLTIVGGVTLHVVIVICRLSEVRVCKESTGESAQFYSPI